MYKQAPDTRWKTKFDALRPNGTIIELVSLVEIAPPTPLNKSVSPKSFFRGYSCQNAKNKKYSSHNAQCSNMMQPGMVQARSTERH
jgi:hypothetical protein